MVQAVGRDPQIEVTAQLDAEIVEFDMQINEGKVELYRARVKVSFKFEGDA